MKKITDYHIEPSDHSPCGAAINQVLQKNPGPLFFPAGTYLIEETLRLPSHTHLKLDAQAEFKLADGAAVTRDDYLLSNADPKEGNLDILIEGGCFNGNQIGNPRPEGLFAEGYTGAMIHFENVRNLRLQNLLMTNAEAYYSRYTHVHDFHIENITFDSQKIRHNNDGVHLGGNCSHGVIRNLRATSENVPGDDLVAVNADDALDRNEVRGMTNGPISDLIIENLEADSCHSFIRLLSVFSPIQNVKIRNLQGGCNVGAINADGARGCRVPVFDENNPPYADGVGLLKNIDIEDVSVAKKRPGNQHGLIDLQSRMKDVSVKHLKRNVDQDLSPEAPTVRIRHTQNLNGQMDGQSIINVNTHPPEEPFETFVSRIEVMNLESSVQTAE